MSAQWPLDRLLSIFSRCMGAPMRLTRRGWETTSSVMFERQTFREGWLTLTFKNRLSELGIPAWVPRDDHPLTRHLVGVADNTAEVDPALSGDPLVYARRAFEAFGIDAAAIFGPALDRAPPLRYVQNSWLNCILQPGGLAAYRADRASRPYMYSK